MDTSPKLAITEHVAFPLETMRAVRFYRVALGSLSTTLRDTPNCQDTANKSNWRKLLLTNK